MVLGKCDCGAKVTLDGMPCEDCRGPLERMLRDYGPENPSVVYASTHATPLVRRWFASAIEKERTRRAGKQGAAR